MKNILGRYINRYEKKHKNFRRYAAVVAVMAVIVFIGVNWRLHYKGISMTSDYQCGLEEHTHTDKCYKKVLICGKEETDSNEGHTHTDDCYKEVKELTCGKEEHKHSTDCYDEDGNLICGKEEHEHTDDCYTTEKKLICGKKESEPVEEHHHTDACYKKELTCDLKEHTHTVACYSNENADVEEKSDWEATIPVLSGNWAEDIVSVAQSQMGYEESTENFKLADDGKTRKGYTRYGAWYGNKYGDWSAMFASFCLNYAEIPAETVPVNSGVAAWIVELKQSELYKIADNYSPTAGDLVFLDIDSDGKADHVGIIAEKETTDGKEGSKETALKVIVGDSNDAVEENTYKTNGDTILGYCALPENPDEKTDQTEAENTVAAEITTAAESTTTVPTVEQKATEKVATQEQTNATEVNFGPYITSASLEKLDGDTWIDATEFQDGDQVRVNLKYEIPKDIVSSANPTIVYQLTDGIKLNKVEQGIVSGTIGNVYYDNLGNYTITEDGKISITFNQTFLSTNKKFTGHIEFQGTASNTSTGTDKDITFGADGKHYTIKPKPVDEDLTIKKEAAKSENGKVVHYTITASSKNGTGTDTVKISDTLSYTGLKPEDVQIGTITVKDKNDNIISGYNVSEIRETQGNKSFDITELPPLGNDGVYTITYDVTYDQIVGNGFSWFNNTAAGYKGNDWKSEDRAYTELSKKMIEKSGSATDGNAKIRWIIKINPDKMSGVAGEYTLSDILKREGENQNFNLADAEGFTIKKINSSWQETDVTATAYNRDTEKITIEDGYSYEIIYKTSVTGDPGSKPGYDNSISIKKDGQSYTDDSTVDVVIPTKDYLKKQSDGIISENDNTVIMNWKTTLVTQYFDEDEIVYTDALLNGNKEVDQNIHYTTDKQLRDSLKISGDKTKVISDYTLICYDKDGNPVSEGDAETKVVSFEITLDNKPEYGDNIFVTYYTTINIKDLDYDSQLRVQNKGEFNSKTAYAPKDYTKKKRLYKYGGRMDENGNISYGSGNTTVDYEAQDGKLYYRIIVNPKTTDAIEISDTLPEGLSIDPKDIKVRYISNINESNQNIYDNENGYDLAKNNHTTIVVNDEGKITINIKKGFPKKVTEDNCGLCIDYVATINDSFWNNLKNNGKTYSNTVSWNSRQERQETTVQRNTEVISKTAEQVVGADGKITNRVKYYVTINPAGDKLNEGRNLTLTDALQHQDASFDINLGSVKLYSYNYKNKANHYKGEELSATSFTFQYDKDKKAFTAVVPDQTPCVLEYEYDIDFGKKQTLELNNSVKLTGKDSTSSNNRISIYASSSSASAFKDDVLEIIKVDSQRYQITLSGAEFRINSYSSENKAWINGSDIYVTGQNNNQSQSTNGNQDNEGTVNIPSEKITKNILYAIEEVKAPSGYKKTDKQYYFVWLDGETADDWWTKNGSNLEDIEKNPINKTDIYFITDNKGTVIIPNQYSKLTITKLWMDSEGKQISDPEVLSTLPEIQVKLKKVRADKDHTTISEDVTNVENPIVTLPKKDVSGNSNNSWTYSWDNLPTREDDGTPIYYVVEEINVPAGYTVSYIGNDGVQSGQISIINKKDKDTYTLPETGGSGMSPFITVGVALMGFALAGIIKKIKCKYVKGK